MDIMCLHLIPSSGILEEFLVFISLTQSYCRPRTPFVFASVTFPSIISEVMMKYPLPLTGQHVAIAIDHSKLHQSYRKFTNSASSYSKVADS